MKELSQIYNKFYSQLPDLQLLDPYLAQGVMALDLGCASGRVLMHFANKGARPSGIELDQNMYEQACKELLGLGIDADIIHGNVLDFHKHLKEKFNLVSILANTYSMFLSQDERLKILENSYEYLVKGGKFVFYVVANFIGDGQREVKLEHNEREYEISLSWKEFSEKREREYTLKVNDEINVFSTRIFNYEDLKEEVRRSNFKIVNDFKDFTGTPFDNDTPQFIGFVLEK